MRRRHDPFLKRLYRAGARDALTLFLPHLADRLDWSQWQWIDKEITILGRRRRSVVADLVGQTREVGGRYLKVLLHPELQMQPDSEMDWRVFEYNTGLLLQEGGPARACSRCSSTTAPGWVRSSSGSSRSISRHTCAHGDLLDGGLGDLEAEMYADQENPGTHAVGVGGR